MIFEDGTAQPQGGGSPVTLSYVGKFTFGMDLGAGGSRIERVFLRFEPPYFIGVGTESQAGTFALYRVTSDNSGHCMLQWTSNADDPTPEQQTVSGFIAITGLGDYPMAFPAHENDSSHFACEFKDDTCRLFIPDRKAYLLAGRRPDGQLGFFTPKSPTMYDSARWSMRRINAFGPDMSGADLRHVQFKKESIAGVSFARANLTRASFSEAKLFNVNFSGATCTRTTFLNAEMASVDFTAATLTNAWFAGANTHELKAPDADFRSAVLYEKTYGPPKFIKANLARAHFNARDLTHAQFDDAELAGADFTDCALTAAQFTNAKMTGAILNAAKAQGAVLQGAVLTSAKAKAAQLQGASFNKATLTAADLSDATFDDKTNFREATLLGIDFSRCRLDLAKFSDTPSFYRKEQSPTDQRLTRMDGATVPVTLLGMDWSTLVLDKATLLGALPVNLTNFKANRTHFPDGMDLKGRTLDNAQFVGATLIEAHMDKVRCSSEHFANFTSAVLRDATLAGAVLPRAVFTGAILSGANLVESKMPGAKFIGAYLNTAGAKTHTDMSYCNLRDADFSNAHLEGDGSRLGAQMSYVLLYGSDAKIANATLTLAVFSGAYLGNLDFRNIKGQAMVSVNFDKACLVNCRFNGSALTDCVLTDACLYGADFSGAELFGAKLSDAWVSSNAQEKDLKLTNIAVLQGVKYGRTTINGEKTNRSSNCPSRAPGPCGSDTWLRPGGLPDEWIYRGKALSEQEPE